MVSTRNHPRAFPPPDLSPTKKTASSTASPEPKYNHAHNDETEEVEPVVYVPTSGTVAHDTIIAPRSGARALTAWSHDVNGWTFLWLLLSLPLVAWDVGYCLLRPHTFPGGKWHLPIWGPYANYVTVDYLYSPLALANNDGFTGAQSAMNVVETAMYLVYAALVYSKGRKTGRGYERRVVGRDGAVVALLAYSAFLMTIAKTVLYGLVGYFSGFHVLRDNSWLVIFFLFIVPNGAWIVVPTILNYQLGKEILRGLERAAGLPQEKLD